MLYTGSEVGLTPFSVVDLVVCCPSLSQEATLLVAFLTF